MSRSFPGFTAWSAVAYQNVSQAKQRTMFGVLHTMKQDLQSLIVVVSASLLLAGCCTQYSAQQWEYKATTTPVGARGITPTTTAQKEAFLNELARDGWVLVDTDGESLYLKRPRK